MGKPPFKPSEGGHIDILRELEEITQGEFQQGSGTSVLLALKVRPEVPPSAGFTHARMGKWSATLRFKYPPLKKGGEGGFWVEPPFKMDSTR
jgi:hypothetical protein